MHTPARPPEGPHHVLGDSRTADEMGALQTAGESLGPAVPPPLHLDRGRRANYGHLFHQTHQAGRHIGMHKRGMQEVGADSPHVVGQSPKGRHVTSAARVAREDGDARGRQVVADGAGRCQAAGVDVDAGRCQSAGQAGDS